MAQTERTENKYNTTCDIYGCSNIAKHVIGKVGEGQAQKILYCDECLQGIINTAPLEMILNRPELAEIEEETTEEKLENVGKALEGEEANNVKKLVEAYEKGLWNPSNLDALPFKEVKEIAVNKGLEFKVGMSKIDLINYIESKEE